MKEKAGVECIESTQLLPFVSPPPSTTPHAFPRSTASSFSSSSFVSSPSYNNLLTVLLVLVEEQRTCSLVTIVSSTR